MPSICWLLITSLVQLLSSRFLYPTIYLTIHSPLKSKESPHPGYFYLQSTYWSCLFLSIFTASLDKATIIIPWDHCSGLLTIILVIVSLNLSLHSYQTEIFKTRLNHILFKPFNGFSLFSAWSPKFLTLIYKGLHLWAHIWLFSLIRIQFYWLSL